MEAPPVLLRRVAAGVLALSLARPVAAAVCVDAQVRPTGLPLNRAVLDTMRSEAAAIWVAYGVVIRWTDGASHDRCLFADAAVAVQVDNATPGRHSTARAFTLGTTTRGASFRAKRVPIRLNSSAVERLLGSLPTETLVHITGRQQLMPADVGRALGRVLAHEIGHVLFDGSRHSRYGLMRASFVPSELVDYRRRAYTLSTTEVVRLAERTARRARQTSDEPATDE